MTLAALGIPVVPEVNIFIAIPPAEKIEIGVDGTISVRPLGQAANELAIVDRIKLVSPPVEDLKKSPDGLIRLASGEDADFDANQRVAQGTLEASNVNVVDEMVNMIELSRRFELQVKMMRTAESNAEASASLVRSA